jgi:hypothetical protein
VEALGVEIVPDIDRHELPPGVDGVGGQPLHELGVVASGVFRPGGVRLVVPVQVIGDLVVVPAGDHGVTSPRALAVRVASVRPVEVPVVR